MSRRRQNKGVKQSPEAKIPTREEILVIADKAHDYIKERIAAIEPARTLRDQVRLGMLVKLLKTYHNMLRIADGGDSDTPAVLARIIYEFSLSIVYMVVNEEDEPDIYEKFRQSALKRSHIMLKNSTKSIYRDRQSSKKLHATIENILIAEGYDVTQKLPDIPKSWHPEVSYLKMAQSLGSEFKEFYHGFYETTSIFIHPNWHDIKRQLSIDDAGNASAALISPPQAVHPIVTATCLMLRAADILHIQALKLGEDQEFHEKMINDINKTHHSLHN